MQTAKWVSFLGLTPLFDSGRLVTEWPTVANQPYGIEMRRGLECGVDAYLLEQEKPIVAFVVKEKEADAFDALRDLGNKLWNQSLTNILVLYIPGEVKIYSLLKKDTKDYSLPYCVATITDKIADSLQKYISQIEDGYFFRKNESYFDQNNRIDRRLLDNLKKARALLTSSAPRLSKEVAQTLLLQILFISYLEDRKIVIESDFQFATNYAYESLSEILKAGDVAALKDFFHFMRGQFNGDMFLAPGVFTLPNHNLQLPELQQTHLQSLYGLRSGKIDDTGQFSLFRLYNFKYIPISLLSAIYDHFQCEPMKSPRGYETSKKRSIGSYFTPAHLAQLCVSLAWKYIPKDTYYKKDFYVLDPACGSAVFLVCVFQRLAGCEDPDNTEGWAYLKSRLLHLHGCDKEVSALGVGIVSLYIALLEYMDPPILSVLRKQGKLLPQLLNKTMHAIDFFKYENPPQKHFHGYDLIIGNPPWLSRQGKNKDPHATKWIGAKCLPFPGNSPTWGFVWKSTQLIKDNGIIALLINAGHIFGTTARSAMSYLYKKFKVYAIINFSDARFQLFEGAQAPAALIIYSLPSNDSSIKNISFYSPKANPDHYKNKRVLLTVDDYASIPQKILAANPEKLNEYKWGTARDRSLIEDLNLLYKPLSTYISSYRKDRKLQGKLVLGQGLYKGDKSYPEVANNYPFLDAKNNSIKWAPITLNLKKFGDVDYIGVDSLRFIKPLLEKKVTPPLILISQGINEKTGQLQAGYTDKLVIFTKSLQAIATSKGYQNYKLLKILTSVLNSKLAAWFYLHSSSVRGVERSKIHLQEILILPFPSLKDTPDPAAGEELVRIFDTIVDRQEQQALIIKKIKEGGVFSTYNNDISELENELNALVYKYYGLSDSEIQIIEDTSAYILPSLQPNINSKKFPIIWDTPDVRMLEDYGRWLQKILSSNYDKQQNISITIYTSNRSPLNVCDVELHSDNEVKVSDVDEELCNSLEDIKQAWPRKFSEGVHSLPHLVFATGARLTLIKPNRIRHWMPSKALIDADRLLADFRRSSLGGHL